MHVSDSVFRSFVSVTPPGYFHKLMFHFQGKFRHKKISVASKLGTGTKQFLSAKVFLLEKGGLLKDK
jgi:hypothetical protein